MKVLTSLKLKNNCNILSAFLSNYRNSISSNSFINKTRLFAQENYNISINAFCSLSTSNNVNKETSTEKVDLSKKHCLPCEGGIPPLDFNSKISLLNNVDKDWKLSGDNKKIFRIWRIPFSKSVEYLNDISKIADEEGHHPDISIESFWNFKITIYTHSINDLTENDYILASKIDNLNIKSFEPRKKKMQNNV
ncbi:hypothetical protein ACTA71_009795 [Dictyostelium dimigraforme]